MRHQITIISFSIVTGLALLVASRLFAQEWTPPPPEKRCPSPWGATDERGAANHMTPDTVLNAARLITEAKCTSSDASWSRRCRPSACGAS
jgi:hypothetical protein